MTDTLIFQRKSLAALLPIFFCSMSAQKLKDFGPWTTLIVTKNSKQELDKYLKTTPIKLGYKKNEIFEDIGQMLNFW